MATKRKERIDPNAAFSAIIGVLPPQTESASSVPEPIQAVDTTQEAAQPAPVAASTAVSTDVRDLKKRGRPKGPANLESTGQESAPGRLVQKGYYLTKPQIRRIGMAAVLRGVDRSSIVREALEDWFAAHEGGGV